ncbi:glutaredoxin family protein [Euzebyella saccharophila]|uniref:Glutaredoxin family protein n=1 Tax=Euzebyella saccharophila TaxID=679664 RepID=A0ABV8JQL6_9FLAO|nr:glutaredoxin family protein [Euzebyella saccharophila]
MKNYLFTLCLTVVIAFSSWGQDSVSLMKKDMATQDVRETIIVYGSDTCHYCLDTKSYLTSKQIAFTYYDVDVNLTKQREMVLKIQLAGLPAESISLPVIDKNGTLFMNDSDFDVFLNRITN